MSDAVTPIPRCDQCTWWEETNVLALGECRLFEADRYHGQMHLDAKLVIRSGRYAKSYEGGVAVTCADFGCAQFQSREAKWMTDGIKTLDEINVSEWARWEWEFEGENKEGRTVLTRGRERLPDEAVKAYRDFKEWLHIRRGIEVVEP